MLFFAMLFACLPHPQTDEDKQAHDPAAISVIEEFVAAKGGEAALRKTKNYSLKGKVLSHNKTIGEFEIYQAENRHLSIDRFPNGATRQKGTNGKIAWQVDVKGEPTLLKGQEARDFIRHNASLNEVLGWRNEFDAICYAGKKTVQDSQAHHLIFVASDKRQINRYFSVESGLLIREEQIVGTGKSMQILISEIRDYAREKDGVLRARQRINQYGANRTIEFKIESAETNTITDDSIFAVPESVAKLVDKDADQGMTDTERAQVELKLFKQIEKGMSEEAVHKLLKDFKVDRGGSGFAIDTYHLSDQTTVKIWYKSGVMAVKHEEDWIIGGP